MYATTTPIQPAFPCARGGLALVLAIALSFAAAALALAASRSPTAPAAHEILSGPIPADVVRVLDGDTVTVRARIWVGQELEIRVRLAGVDAPELHGRCAVERDRARLARDFLRARIAGRPVRLYLVQYGKYAGRVLARVEAADGTDLGAALLAAGLARPYNGGRRQPWCGE